MGKYPPFQETEVQSVDRCIAARASCKTGLRRWLIALVVLAVAMLGTIVASIANAAADHREFRIRLQNVEAKQTALDQQIVGRLGDIRERLRDLD